jgi:hypothetical protein
MSNGQHIHLDKAWSKVTMKLSFNADNLSDEFKSAIYLDAPSISLSEFNDVLYLFDALGKKDKTEDMMDNYIEQNIFNKKLYSENLGSSDKWNNDLFFNVNVLQRLNKKPVIKVMKKHIMSNGLLNHDEKEELAQRSREEWIELISEAEGTLLKRSIEVIGSFNFPNGEMALEEIKKKSPLNKIAIEILQKSVH